MKIIKKDISKLRIDPVSSALLVIDMQKAFLERNSPLALPGASKIVPRIQKLISQFRKSGMPIFFTRVYHDDMYKGVYPQLFPDHFDSKGKPLLRRNFPNFQIIDELKPEPKDIIIDKSRYSAFYGTKLESILRRKQINTLVIVGLATNVCCESTARDAFFRNFRVIVVSDMNVTYSKKAHEASLENISSCFGFVAKYFDIQKMLLVKGACKMA
jgi:nicotinamidase-related amidase